MWSGDHRTTIPDVAVELVMSSLRSRRWRRPPNRPRLVEWDLELGSRPPGCLWAGSWCHPGSTKGRQSHFQFWDMRTMTLRPSLLEAHCCPSCHNLKYPGHQTRDATAREATDCSLRCPDQCKRNRCLFGCLCVFRMHRGAHDAFAGAIHNRGIFYLLHISKLSIIKISFTSEATCSILRSTWLVNKLDEWVGVLFNMKYEWTRMERENRMSILENLSALKGFEETKSVQSFSVEKCK